MVILCLWKYGGLKMTNQELKKVLKRELEESDRFWKGVLYILITLFYLVWGYFLFFK